MRRTAAQLARDWLTLGFLARGWRVACFTMLGVAAGMGLLVFHISRAGSYLSDAPETCMNCHVMTTAYLTWQHSRHARVTTCNDCHVPHESPAAQYAFKAEDGLWHATVFTMHWEPQVIRLSQRAVPVVENNCRRCHARLLDDVHLNHFQPGDLRCWDCHREVPHGRVHSLSATPGIFQPILPPVSAIDRGHEIGGRAPRLNH